MILLVWSANQMSVLQILPTNVFLAMPDTTWPTMEQLEIIPALQLAQLGLLNIFPTGILSMTSDNARIVMPPVKLALEISLIVRHAWRGIISMITNV